MDRPSNEPTPSDAELRRLVDAARALTDEERLRLLEESCRDPAALRSIVQRLAERAAAETRLRETATSESPAPPPGLDVLDALRARAGSFSRYEPRGEIGRGGMAVVTEVRDLELDRTLAMKVLRTDDEARLTASPSDPRSLGRFLDEAKVTSQLDHPGVVPVHELGLDADGRLYFTMKRVRGEDLRSVFRRVFDQNDDEWTVPRALSVLLRVCEAMAYAHSKGVLHRDLKPGNVMVGRYGETYVMDWGLAKVVGREDRRDIRLAVDRTDSLRSVRRDGASATPDSPLVTLDGDVVGTPAYMAPEQAAGLVDVMGPPADVYAVGAMLYHLLTARMPYVPDHGSISPRTVLARLLDGPPRPLSEAAPQAPPELAAICERAMARRVEDRYATMDALAEDLRAFLEQRVVSAYAAGPIQELRKWVARNRGLAASMAAGLLVAVGSGFGLAWQQRELASERALAASRIREEQAVGDAVLDFQRRVLRVDAWEDGREIKALDLVDRAAAEIDEGYADRPGVEAAIRLSLAETYRSFGRFEEAAAHAERAHVLSHAVHGSGDRRTARAADQLATALLAAGREAEAADLLERAVADRAAAAGTDDEEVRLLELAWSEALRRVGRLDEAEALQRDLVDAWTERLGTDRDETRDARFYLAATLVDRRRYDEAEALHREVLESLRRTHGPDHPQTLLVLEHVAGILRRRGDREQELSIMHELVEKRRRALGEDHPETLKSLDDLALALGVNGRTREQEEIARDVLERMERVLGADHPATLSAMNNLVFAVDDVAATEEGRRLQRELVARARASLGDADPFTVWVVKNLANELRRAGSDAEAEALARDVLATARDARPDHGNTLDLRRERALALLGLGRREESIPLLRELLEIRRRLHGPRHPDVVEAVVDLARALPNEPALALLEAELRAADADSAGAPDGSSASLHRELARLLHRAGRHEEEEEACRRLVDQETARAGPTERPTRRALRAHARALRCVGRLADAEARLRVLLQTSEDGSRAADATAVAGRIDLADVLHDLERHEEEVVERRRVVEAETGLGGPTARWTLAAKRELARALHCVGHTEEAAAVERELLEHQRAAGAEDAARHRAATDGGD